MKAAVISKDPEIQKRYAKMIREGASPKLAEMLALQQAPGVNTDTVFMLDRKTGGGQFANPFTRQYYTKKARQAGVVTDGKYYEPQLASFPGDPSAWVSSRGDVLALAKAKNLDIDGDVKHRSYAVEEPLNGRDKPYEAADSIVDEALAREVEANPGLKEKPKKLADKRGELKEKLSGR